MSLTPTGFPSGGVFPTGFPGAGGPGGVSISGNTAGTTGLISTGTLILDGGNNITLSQNGNTITIVGGAGGGGGGVDISLSGNTSGTLTLISSGTAILAGGNNITLSQVGQSITISAFNQSVQTQNLVDVSLSGNTTGTLALVSSGTLILAGGNNITLSQNGQSVTISAFSQTVQTQNLHDLSLSGNTVGALALISSGTGILAGGNNITLSQNGQSVTISAANQTNQSLGIYASSQTTGASSSSTYDARSLSIVGSGGVSLGWTNGSLLVNDGWNTISNWWAGPSDFIAFASNTNTFIQNTLYLAPLQLKGFFTGTAANHLIQVSLSTSATNNSTASGSINFNIGLYTRTGSTLSLASSGSQAYTFTNVSNNNASQISGTKYISAAINVNCTPGEYWLGYIISTGSAGNLGCSFSAIFGVPTAPPTGILGAASNSTYQFLPGWGLYGTSTAAFPASIGFNQIDGNAVSPKVPLINFVNFTS